MTKRQLILIKVAMMPVAIAAAWNSYWHTVHVAAAYGQDMVSAHMLPLSIDGLMLIASVVVGHAHTNRSKAVGWLALTVGFGASFAANMLATDGGLIAHIISGWYALSLLLAVELFQSTNKRAVTRRRRQPAKRAAPRKAPATKRTRSRATQPQLATAAA